jgi:hypothetical protein
VKRIRGGAGLGDAIYLRPIVEHLLAKGEQVTVCTSYGAVFDGLTVKIEPFDRFNIDVLAHYTAGKRRPGTNQWDDLCASAGIEVALKFPWAIKNTELITKLKAIADGRPLVLVSGGRAPMARTDGFGMELLPRREAFEGALEAVRDCMLVQIGRAQQIYPLKTELDLNGSTSITDLFDLACACDGVIGQCSFVIPLAEVFDKPLLIVWAAEGMSPARHWYISSITPQKVLSKPSSKFVVDDQPLERIQEATRAFRNI